MKRKLKDIWLLINSKYYVVLTASSKDEISWAVESLRKADNECKKAN